MKIKVKTIILIIGLLSSTCLFGQSSIDKGKVLYESKKYPEAEKVFKAVPEKTTDYAAAQYYLGRIAFDKKEYDDAADYFEKAKELNPKNAEYFNWLGDTYATIGKDANIFKQMSVGPKALRAWEKATQLDAKNINARVSLVGAYMQAPAFMGGGTSKANKMAVEAFPLLDEELKKTPDHHLYLYWYGKSSAITGLNLDRGEECMMKYLNYTPKDDEPPIAGAYMRLGQIREKKGNKAEAKKNYETAVKLDKSLDQAKEGLERTSK
ncbi:MAG: tetratricopeptide repeat protein [Bacteroidetes bacterium]|nr:tetratricopeptide repeat protein [Bacteroidota bacterium]